MKRFNILKTFLGNHSSLSTTTKIMQARTTTITKLKNINEMSPQSKENISRENYSSFTKTKTVTEMVSSKTTKKIKTTVQGLDNVKTFLGYHSFSADCRRNWTNLNKTSTKLKTFHKLRSSSQTATTMITSKQQQQEETFTQERHKQQQQVTERAQNIPLLS